MSDRPIVWRRAAGREAGDCVEVADSGGGMLVRNSTDPNGPVLSFTADEWDTFVGGIRDGEFDLDPPGQ